MEKGFQGPLSFGAGFAAARARPPCWERFRRLGAVVTEGLFGVGFGAVCVERVSGSSSLCCIMDQVMQFVEPSRQFVKDSIRLVKRCTKPDRKEFQKIAMATAIGFAIMGFIGFFVKLIHIPINNIIV
ncbi:hypothetical protein EI555_005274 [Monodon monoceros]|uniref:Protein transport protein Sec61 subunit gamma n=1 Tax=Monodon monoceros TaxID=40151 RepID=A0A4U1ERE1_MONMO|nr:hypothetical protein EI555_005274 [Monodon monoceros]